MTGFLENPGRFIAERLRTERVFLAVLGLGFLVVGLTYQTPSVACWVGFVFAAYAAVANDSIQTIGTFIASNKKAPWWFLWLFMGGIFLVTVGYSWVTYAGDVTYARLASKGFENAPTEFTYLQVAAPLILMLLTRLKMPVSTTFLLLSSFAASASSIGKVLGKSFTGYALAFVIAFVVWMLLSKAFERWFKGEPHPGWRVFQWLTSGLLWSVWIMQDAANIAVYLPRQLNGLEFAAFAGVIFIGLGILFRSGGEKIQEIVDEKASVVDVRMATMIDLVYAVILFYFKLHSQVPMSTTWVFIGLLGGRELAMAFRGASERGWVSALKLLVRDTGFAIIGLIVSMVLAASVNPAFMAEVKGFFGVQ